MSDAPELVTVYRSMDLSAVEDCEILADLLMAEGLSPSVCDDQEPGIPEGVYELRVPADQAARAEEIIKANPLPDEVDDIDTSSDLELETIYHSEGSSTAELETMGIKTVLESNGIAAMVVGDSVLPNFPYEVRVAKEHADRARQLMAEALESGPAAADAGELQSEQELPPV